MKERASSANFFADNDDLLVTSRLIERKRFFKFFILIKLSYKTLKKKQLLRADDRVFGLLQMILETSRSVETKYLSVEAST